MGLLTYELTVIYLMIRERQEVGKSCSHITFQKSEKCLATIQVYHKFVFGQAQILTEFFVIRQFSQILYANLTVYNAITPLIARGAAECKLMQ